MDFALFFVFFCGLAAGIALSFAFIVLVKREAKSMQARAANAAGRSKQEAQGERMAEAMAKAMAMSKDEAFMKPDKNGEMKPDFVKIALALLPQYPDVAMLVMRKMGFEGLKGLI